MTPNTDCQPETSLPPAVVQCPKVSVVIVTYGSANELPGCLESLNRQALPIEIFLIDNASRDETPDMIRTYAACNDNVHAILNHQNIGLAAGNNCALDQCTGQYVLMLNPDTVLCDDTLTRLVEFLDKNPDVGVVGPKNLYQDGRPHVSAHRHWNIVDVLLWRVVPYRFPRKIYDKYSAYTSNDPLFVSGSCLLIRRSILEQIGGYDPEYFLTIEDVCDLCIRAKRAGCRIAFQPEAEVFHFAGRSCVQVPYTVVWHAYRGSVYHFLKHKGVAQALIVLILLSMASAGRAVTAALMGTIMKKYRSIGKTYAKVFVKLLLHNPIFQRNRSSNTVRYGI